MSHKSNGSLADAAYAELQSTLTHRATDGASSKSSGNSATVVPAGPAAGAGNEPSSPAELSLWQQYLRQLSVRPVQTKALTSAACAGVASCLAQRSMGVPFSQLNFASVRNQAILGFIRGPTIHYWQELLTKFFSALGYTTPASQTKTPVVLGKLVLDQTIFASGNLLWFIYALGWLEGRTTAQSTLKIQADLFSMLKMNWRLWPLVNYVNFTYVPPALRVLTLNLVGIGWMVYLVRTMANAAAAAAKTAATVLVVVPK